MSRAALATVTVLTLAACGPGGVVGPDGGDVDGTSPLMSGLVFRFVAPDLGDTGEDLTVSHIYLSVRDVRALGDAAPGDARTTLDRGEIELPDDAVPEIRFDQAPPGRYSQFEFVIDRSQDGEASWTMEGAVRLNGEDWSFAIDDDDSHPISVPLPDVNLRAGEVATITVEIDVVAIANDVDWEALPQEDPIVIDDDSPQELAAVTANLITAFSIADVDVQ